MKMSIECRKEMLLQQLDVSGQEGYSGANCTSAHALLTEYHDIFSLEPGGLGCTGLAKHDIRVVDDEPFKERFQRIPPHGGGSEGSHEGNVRSRCYSP